MTEVEKSKLTQEFLKCIAQHLSSRAECKGESYRISIDSHDIQLMSKVKPVMDNDLHGGRILFSPNILVFPDRYHRKETDKVNVVYHVLSSHFSNRLLMYSEDVGEFVNSSNLVSGTYEYQPSVDNKKRRWVRIESL